MIIYTTNYVLTQLNKTYFSYHLLTVLNAYNINNILNYNIVYNLNVESVFREIILFTNTKINLDTFLNIIV